MKCALQLLSRNQINSNQMLVLEERGKPEYPEKNLSEQSREPTRGECSDTAPTLLPQISVR